MKRILPYLLLSAAIVLFSACSKSKSERLVGVWQFDKVKKRDFGMNSDLTDQYLNSSVKFNDDQTVSYYDSQTKIVEEGTWEFYSYETWDNNNDQSETVTDLYIFLLDTAINDYKQQVWKDINITSRKITTTVDQPDGSNYKYNLIRVEK